jgi:hypothetical protein
MPLCWASCCVSWCAKGDEGGVGRLAIGVVTVVESLRSRVLDDTIYFLPTGVKRRGRALLVMVWKQLFQEPLDRNLSVNHT